MIPRSTPLGLSESVRVALSKSLELLDPLAVRVTVRIACLANT
jgi:hypothetical protein